MDYSQLSDRDIDALVLQEIYGNQAKDKDIMRAWLRGGFKYTTNPADAWPIISANRISIEYDAEERCDTPVEWVTAYGIDEIKVHVVSHQPCDKALRSAMIVFLMMQDANHA